MPPTPSISTPIDVTNLDFDMAFGRMVELIGSVYPWLDLESRAEMARLHLEAFAHLSGHFHYYLNRIGRESRWGTAIERSHLLALTKLIGYRPASARAAIATQSFTLLAPAAADVTIQAGSFVRNEDVNEPLRFQLLSDVVITAGSSTNTGTVENSETRTEVYVSDGTAYQRFRLGYSPYLDDSMRIETPLGTWSEVTNFLRSGKDDRHFVTSIDSQDRVTVIFGNGRTGAVPTSPITFTYKTGGGVAGRLPADALRVLEGTYTDANGTTVTILTTNPAATTGAADRETDAEIRVNAPASIEVSQRAVSRMDYEREALRVPGVAFALMLTRNEDPAVLENEGFLFVVPEDGGTASDDLLLAVASRFGDAVAVGSGGVYQVIPEGETPKTVTFQLRVRAAAYKVIDLYAKVYRRKGVTEAAVRAAIEQAYANYFAVTVPASSVGLGVSGNVPNPRVNFGYYLQDVDGIPTGHFPISSIEALVLSATGVRELGDGPADLTLNGVPRNVEIATYEFPKAGTVTLLVL